MKLPLLAFVLLVQSTFALSGTEERLVSAYFERPVSCPLRFSSLSNLRDQVQTLTSSLGSGCTQSGQQALNQLNNSVANLEGIASTWNTYSGSDTNAQNAQLAKNASQVLGSLNIITSNNACFYDIRSRGTLPVISDIIMSLSQLGLLIPSTTGAMVATGGYLVGSGLKIVNELVKKKFNWNKPEERRAFLQLNCAFFDQRRVMEEMGLFNPESKSFRQKLLYSMKRERLELIKLQKEHEQAILENEAKLDEQIQAISGMKEAGLNPLLVRKLEELSANLASRPVDHAAKWKQLSVISTLAPDIELMLRDVKLVEKEMPAVRLMLNNLETLAPDWEQNGKAWNTTIDDYELKYRGPILAFAAPISNSLNRAISYIEAAASADDKELARIISELRVSLKESKSLLWGASQRLTSVEAKINSLEESDQRYLFSENDEGKSDAVEILDYYRKLQLSILGREGKGYIKNSLGRMEDLQEGLDKQINLFDGAQPGKEQCAAAEKLRFAWAQYRFKAQEAFDFVATNQDLFRSSYKIGNERQKIATKYVLAQFSSVEDVDNGDVPAVKTIGHFMNNVRLYMNPVESKLQASECF